MFDTNPYGLCFYYHTRYVPMDITRKVNYNPSRQRNGGDMSRIERIELFRVAMELIYPWRTAYGSDDVIETVLVKMDAGGITGWGEATPLGMPHYCSEYTKGTYNVMRDFLAPALIGKEIASAADLQKEVSWVKGNQFAKGGLEEAWWDIYAKSREEPLWKTLGGTGPKIEVGNAMGVVDSIDILLEGIEEKLKAGFKRMKLKFCRGWDLDMLSAVRDAYPDTVLHIDCNSSYTLDDLPMFKKLDKYNLAMIEQPLAYDDLIDHAELQSRIATPICLDESITSPDKARKAAKIKACQWVNIKPCRVGGIANSLEINRICEEAGIPCWIGSMLESGLGTSFQIALATLPNIKYPSDIVTSDRFYAENIACPPIVLSSPSEITASSAPGVGSYPDPQRLEKSTMESIAITG